jgi:outer membrane lipase/esterase
MVGVAALGAAMLAACGGGSDGSGYSRMVVFGDSLSDVGTYATAGVRQLGGGKYTVNGANAKIWVEMLADTLGVAAPCAAQTGLEATGALAPLAAPITNVAGCFGYAQGGARVTNPVGPSNKALLSLGDASGALGQITSPVTSQVARHLAAANNSFAGNDLVTVLAGANDLFMQLGTMNARIAAGVAQQTAANDALAAMGTAGAELATLIRTQLVARGASRVLVVTVPDVSTTPFGRSLGAASAPLLQNLSVNFNNQLLLGLNGVQGVLTIDGYTLTRDIAATPAAYGITNNTVPACDARATLGSLSCSAATVPAGVDVSTYQYADAVHPTPLGHKAVADHVTARLRAAGWL